jgi:4-amino-4-deoxy-L-arabinose transferase-like glycosyltransferase
VIPRSVSRWLRHPDAPAVLGLAGLAVVARALYWWSVRNENLYSDAQQYHEIAANLAAGKGFSHTFPQVLDHPTAFRPPLYPFLLSLWYRLVGSDPVAGRVFGVIIGVAVVLAVFWVVKRHGSRTAGLVAAGLVAVFPPLIANDIVTLTEGLSLLLIVLLLDAAIRRRWALTGLLCGLLTLARPSAQFLIVLVAIWFLFKLDWKRAAASAGICVLLVTPWVVRNAVVLDRPVLVTSNGFNLAAMYSQEAQDLGAFIDPAYHPNYEDVRLLQFDEGRWDAELQRRGLRNLREDPSQLLQVSGRNLTAYFELDPSANENPEWLDGRNLTVRTWALPFFYVVAVLGIVGLWRARRTELALLSALVACYFTLASLVFVAPPRLRAPVDLVFCIGVGLLVGWRPARDDDTAPVDVSASQVS